MLKFGAWCTTKRLIQLVLWVHSVWKEENQKETRRNEKKRGMKNEFWPRSILKGCVLAPRSDSHVYEMCRFSQWDLVPLFFAWKQLYEVIRRVQAVWLKRNRDTYMRSSRNPSTLSKNFLTVMRGQLHLTCSHKSLDCCRVLAVWLMSRYAKA
jgi:hypothetical protein